MNELIALHDDSLTIYDGVSPVVIDAEALAGISEVTPDITGFVRAWLLADGRAIGLTTEFLQVEIPSGPIKTYLVDANSRQATILSDFQTYSPSITVGTFAFGSIATQDANNVDVDGGSVNGTTIGDSAPESGTFTTMSANDISLVSAGVSRFKFAFSSGQVFLQSFDSSGTFEATAFIFDSSVPETIAPTNIRPFNNQTEDLGTSTNQWGNIYSQNVRIEDGSFIVDGLNNNNSTRGIKWVVDGVERSRLVMVLDESNEQRLDWNVFDALGNRTAIFRVSTDDGILTLPGPEVSADGIFSSNIISFPRVATRVNNAERFRITTNGTTGGTPVLNFNVYNTDGSISGTPFQLVQFGDATTPLARNLADFVTFGNIAFYGGAVQGRQTISGFLTPATLAQLNDKVNSVIDALGTYNFIADGRF